MTATTEPFNQTTNQLADQAAQGAQGAVRGAQRATDQALDALSDKVDDVRDQAMPALNRMAARAEALARRSADVVRDGSAQIKDRAQRTGDMTIGYIKDEPVKAMLIAAATGAALMALISLMSRRD